MRPKWEMKEIPRCMKEERRISQPVKLAQEKRKEVGREESMQRGTKMEERASQSTRLTQGI